MTPVAPRLANNVSYATRIKHGSLCVAGVVFGEAGG